MTAAETPGPTCAAPSSEESPLGLIIQQRQPVDQYLCFGSFGFLLIARLNPCHHLFTLHEMTNPLK